MIIFFLLNSSIQSQNVKSLWLAQHIYCKRTSESSFKEHQFALHLHITCALSLKNRNINFKSHYQAYAIWAQQPNYKLLCMQERRCIACQDDIYTQSKQAAQPRFSNVAGCLQALIFRCWMLRPHTCKQAVCLWKHKPHASTRNLRSRKPKGLGKIVDHAVLKHSSCLAISTGIPELGGHNSLCFAEGMEKSV